MKSNLILHDDAKPYTLVGSFLNDMTYTLVSDEQAIMNHAPVKENNYEDTNAFNKVFCKSNPKEGGKFKEWNTLLDNGFVG